MTVHTNDPGVLPPVACPILIAVNADNVMIRAERISHLRDRSGDMDYRLENGEVIVGRFRWTYP